MSSAHSQDPRRDARKKLKLAFVLTFLFFLAELAGGLWSNSLALLSDAGHMLGDLVALTLSLLSIVWASKSADMHKTYGYHRAEVLATLVNGALLLYVALQILMEAGRRIVRPESVELRIMLPVAVAGLAVNVICAFLLRSHAGHLVTKSAFYHIVSDLISSVCVILAGLVMFITHWKWVDAPMSAVIALLIVRNAYVLLKEVYDILMEASPPGVRIQEVREALLKIDGVEDVHDLHVWTIGSGFCAASTHLVVRNMEIRQGSGIMEAVNGLLRDRFQIEHTTVQLAAKERPEGIQALSGKATD